MRTTARDEMEAELRTVISEWQEGRSSFRLLDAGGGSLSRIPTEVVPVLTVVDISPEQLERNIADEKILGDLHEVDLGVARFDAAVAWDVIEHLADPWKVVRKLLAAVVPGGIVILAGPSRYSLQALVTRLTPHSFHVWVYRHIFKKPHAGEPGRAPFPTVHHADISPDRLADLIAKAGHELLYFRTYERSKRGKLKKTVPLLGLAYDMAARIGSSVSGRNMLESDFVMVIRPAADGGR
ncbi:class I SAM-dependent methyltransferase [Sphingomonas japonica]|uniref:SAM-dependent methyltransferase n=1 Tax=Sphingomonas japonica TaxID=511662 RepID=A0ABX0U3K5_9SPHN|nr:methyltransferase domain-containing protein [Sphingomonas japonica]NIJ25160.1 SAM-dependent methyltransferase [Sphingomonas japonica]